jgi:hypothetical protein
MHGSAFFLFQIKKGLKGRIPLSLPVLGVEPRISSLEGLRVGPFCYTGGFPFLSFFDPRQCGYLLIRMFV